MTDDEEFDQSELTTEELAELLSTGGTIEVYLSDALAFDITLAEVALSVRIPLEDGAIKDLAGALPDAIRLHIPPIEQVIAERQEVDPGERALLQRALEARASLLGG